MKKFIRYQFNKKAFYGEIINNTIFELKGNFISTNSIKYAGNKLKLKDVNLLPPVEPSKIICLAYNYKDLVGKLKKYKEPLLFSKPITSLLAPNKKILISNKTKTWTEVELAIIVGKKCKKANILKAKRSIFGYTIANDVTMKNIANRDHHLLRSKGCDTFCPLGPWIITNIDTHDLNLTNRINGKIFQISKTSNRILNDAESLSLVSNFVTLYPGDVILTGSPANAMNSIIKKNDKVEMTIENIGTLKNIVSQC